MIRRVPTAGGCSSAARPTDQRVQATESAPMSRVDFSSWCSRVQHFILSPFGVAVPPDRRVLPFNNSLSPSTCLRMRASIAVLSVVVALLSACSAPAQSGEEPSPHEAFVFDPLNVSFPEVDAAFVEGAYECTVPGYLERLVVKDGRFHLRYFGQEADREPESGTYRIDGDTLRLLGRHGLDLDAIRAQGIDEQSWRLLYDFDAFVPARVDGVPALWRKIPWEEYSNGSGFRPRDILRFVGPPTAEEERYLRGRSAP
jgi:hypothetical protein